MLIVAALFGHVQLPSLTSPNEIHTFGAAFLVAFGLMFYTVMSVYATWYLLDCLYADRKDRSILFWKSLPISDTDTVISKLIVALIVIPVVSFVAADITALLAAFIVSIRPHGARSAAPCGSPICGCKCRCCGSTTVVTAAIWYLPVAGWLMLVSAWAKRAVILWSFLPPLAALHHRALVPRHQCRRPAAQPAADRPADGCAESSGARSWHVDDATHTLNLPSSVFHFINPSGFFSSPETWIGAAVGAALIA